MDKLEQKEMKKIRPIKNTCYDWLINYIPEPIRKSEGGFKDKVISLFRKGNKLNKSKTQKQEDDYCKVIRVDTICNNNYIEYGTNGNRHKSLSLDEYLDKIRPYLKDIIIGLQESDTWKIQYDNDVNEVVDELFKSLNSIYQGSLETLMRGSDFIFDSVKLLYYKRHKIILDVVVHI